MEIVHGEFEFEGLGLQESTIYPVSRRREGSAASCHSAPWNSTIYTYFQNIHIFKASRVSIHSSWCTEVPLCRKRSNTGVVRDVNGRASN